MDLLNPLAGFLVGVLVGFTGVGGGALMTPLLVFLFGVAFLLLLADVLHERVPPLHAVVLASPAACLVNTDAQTHGLVPSGKE